MPIGNPEYWRSRAEEARALAEMLEDSEAKLMMMGVVEGYERLAEYAVRRKQESQKSC